MGLLNASESTPLDGGASYTFGHRLHRLVWVVAWGVLASWTPAPFHRWRVALLRLFGADVHSSAHVYSSARIWYPPNLYMGPHSCLAPKVNCYCMAAIRLGPHAIVSQGTHLCAGMHDIEDPNFQLVVRPITIGAGAWVAAEAFVGPGVTIGEYAVVGARSVIFKSAEKNGVYAGNPASLIKFRQLRSLGDEHV